jgi:outer membrane cobalamin receptor
MMRAGGVSLAVSMIFLGVVLGPCGTAFCQTAPDASDAEAAQDATAETGADRTAAHTPPPAAAPGGPLSFIAPQGDPAGFDQSGYVPYTLGEIVVAGQTKANEIALYNEVSAEKIAATNSKTAAEALRYATGVEVLQGAKNEPDVRIHGMGQEKVLVLIDGVPYYETNYGKLNLNQIPADIIAKIEVIKGAPSVIYGPNAEAGVINIVTRNAGKPFTLGSNVELGEKDHHRVSATTGGEEGILRYWFNYTHNETGAWRMSDNFKATEGTILSKPGGARRAVIDDGGFRSNSSFKTDSFWAKLGVTPAEDSEYFVNAYWIMSKWGWPPSVADNTVFPDPPAFSQFSRFDRYDDWGVDLNAKQRITERLLLRNNAYFHNHQDALVSYSDEEYTDKLARSAYRDYSAGDSVFADYDLTRWDTFRLALHYKIDSHRERDDSYLPFSESLSNTGSVAAENEFRLVKNLTAVAGMGWDWFDVWKSQRNTTGRMAGAFTGRQNNERPGLKDMLTPMGGLEYRLPDTTKLFTSLARKGRFPTLQQLYSSKGGNPDLDPETSLNYTLGASRSFLDEMVWAEVAYFNHYLRDYISRDGPDSTNIYRNYGRIVMNGIELNTEFRPFESAAFTLGYTYNRARDHSRDRATDCVVDLPAHKIDMGLRYTLPYAETRIDLTQQITGRIFSQLPTAQDPGLDEEVAKGYYLCNLKFTQPLTRYLDGYVSLENIWDRNYETVYGFPQRGRTVLFGIDARY